VSKAKDINTSAHAGIDVDSIIRSGIERFPAALSTIQRSNLEGVLGSIGLLRAILKWLETSLNLYRSRGFFSFASCFGVISIGYSV
jgi:hypothetical protein